MVFPNRSSNRGGRRRGVAAAELAILAAVLLFVLLGAMDFCRLFFHYNTITNAARNGALWLSDPLGPTQSPYTTFQDAALADAPDLNPAPNVTLWTAPTTVSVTVQYQLNMLSSYLGFGNVNLSRTVTMRRGSASQLIGTGRSRRSRPLARGGQRAETGGNNASSQNPEPPPSRGPSGRGRDHPPRGFYADPRDVQYCDGGLLLSASGHAGGEGARYASVHGSQYAPQYGDLAARRPISTIMPLLPMAVGLNPSNLTYRSIGAPLSAGAGWTPGTRASLLVQLPPTPIPPRRESAV